MSNDLPLAVDLDGTLIATDAGYESVVRLLRERPLLLFLLPFWLCQGLGRFKRAISQRTTLPVSELPFRSEVVAYVRSQHERGRKVILATASDQSVADSIGQHLPLFSETIGSDGITNLKGSNKAAFLNEKFGAGRYVYAGDSRADLAIWPHSGGAVVVSSKDAYVRKVEKLAPVEKVFAASEASLSIWLKQLRVKQWAKNLLLFVPILLAHKYGDSSRLLDVGIIFVAFSLCASGVYLLNDLLDLEADRRHRTKRSRPLASGQISIVSALTLTPLLFVAGLMAAFSVSQDAGLAVLGYLALTSWYSFYAKAIAVVDVVLLGGLYCWRLVTGAIAAEVVLSPWLTMFGAFLFFSLACVKRVSEMMAAPEQGRIGGRGYHTDDLGVIQSLGAGSVLLSSLVFALYVNSPDVTRLYAHPERLWLFIPLLIAWVARIWLLTARGEDLEDPILFALNDRFSYGCALAAIFLVVIAL